jgi:hypothetical protein
MDSPSHLLWVYGMGWSKRYHLLQNVTIYWRFLVSPFRHVLRISVIRTNEHGKQTEIYTWVLFLIFGNF